jgi:hypothetical protein
MTNNEAMHAKSKSKVRRRYPALQLFRIEPECGGYPETAARRGQPAAGTDRVGVVDQVSPPAMILDDRVDVPISINRLGDVEVDSNRTQRDRVIFGPLLGHRPLDYGSFDNTNEPKRLVSAG